MGNWIWMKDSMHGWRSLSNGGVVARLTSLLQRVILPSTPSNPDCHEFPF
jgi:hypothetical protein